MNQQQFYTLLYDMALATSGETQVAPLLTKALQRLLYHTGFPCGLYIRSPSEAEKVDKHVSCLLELRICSDDLLPEQGEQIDLCCNLLDGPTELIDANNILGTGNSYSTALRVPVKNDGCFILLSPNPVSKQMPYRQLFEPIMGNFSKNLRLCRDNEANTQILQKEIEEHKQTLVSLRESEINHKEAQRLGKIGHWILQQSTGELTWSDEIYRIFGRKREDFEPSLDNFYNAIHPDDLPHVKKAVDTSNQTGLYKIEHRILLPDDSIRWVHEQARIIMNDEGETLQMVGTVQDITEQKHAVEEKEILMRQLQQSQKMESIGHLTGGIAHDFNNILAAMLGFAELLQDMIPANADENMLLGYVDEIITGGERARDLVAQMLAFSRGQTGNSQDVNPISVVKEATRLVQAMIPSSITIQTKLETVDEMIHIDPVQLHQVIMNLVINARDAMDTRGTITVGLKSVTTGGECDSCHEHFEDQYLELYVIDSGSGIEDEILNRIFDPFYTSKDVGKGTGMGLSVVHGIVHQGGGHIKVRTSSKTGTCISLLFPVISNEEKATGLANNMTAAN